MSDSAPAQRYPSSAIAIHWLVLLLVVAVYACILLRENYPRGSEIREALKAWHFTLGLTVLAISGVRLALRGTVWKTPAIAPPPPAWMSWLSMLAHIAIYALFIAMPIAGWLILSAEGDAIPFWGLNLPSLIRPNEQLAKQIEELHEAGGTVGYFLIGLHAAAALFHHHFLKDNTLKRMLPGGGEG